MCELQLAKAERQYWLDILKTTKNRLLKRIAESNLKTANKILRKYYSTAS